MDILKEIIKEFENNSSIIKDIAIFRNEVIIESVRYGASGVISNNSDVYYPQRFKCYSDFKGKRVNYLLQTLSNSMNVLDRSIITAAINSVTDKKIDYKIINTFDVFSDEFLKNKKISFLGHFPRADKMKKRGLDINIIELIPREGDVLWNESDSILRESEIVFITGTTLINNTLNDVIKKTPNAKYRILVGPTVPICEKIFDYGINVIGATIIKKPELLINYWRGGGSGIKYAPEESIEVITVFKEKNNNIF